MQSCKKIVKGLSIFVLCLWLSTVQAGIIGINNARITASDNEFLLSADFSIGLGPRLKEILDKGITLFFIVDFELTRPRWYWFDKTIAVKSQTWRLSYHTLTQQYRLSTGAFHLNFSSLNEALRILSRLRNWPVSDMQNIEDNETYDARLRMYLDLKQLPQLFQVTATSDSEWQLASGWTQWTWSPDLSMQKKVTDQEIP